MRPTHIVIHHSLTKDSETVSWGAIRRYHTKELGWRAIGYHFGIELARDQQETFLGRFPGERGAHCPQDGMNRVSLGICLVGNFDEAEPPAEQWQRALELVRWLMDEYDIPRANVTGHTEHNPYKSCPGKKFDLEKFRREL